MVGLADCNNFFVSCERTVDSSLIGKAVVVGSNNDGCVVARSNEAKALGVKMGQPLFELKKLIGSGALIAISGHHLLYREISLNIHSIFRRFIPRINSYSIDEAFLDMSGIEVSDFTAIGQSICDSCWEELRIPVTIGFSYTKTLAKITTELSKKKGEKVGLLLDKTHIDNILTELPISDLWGIGRRWTKRLYQYGIFTIADFAGCDRNKIRAIIGINGERSWFELHGVDCMNLSHLETERQNSISETRTFPSDVDDYDYIKARIATYASDCAKKLRAMNGLCCQVTVFLRTNRFHEQKSIYKPTSTLSLPGPTDNTVIIVSTAIELLHKIWRSGISFKRAGVILDYIISKDSFHKSLFDFDQEEEHEIKNKLSPSLSKVLDSLNHSIGKPVIKLASQIGNGHPDHNDGYSSSFQAPGI